jgi:putative CocE/NonD family hydrolase
MPASWGAAADAYRDIATRFAKEGYVVVSYAQRGFGGSSGRVDFAGPATQHDARAVIDWALHHTRADPKRIAMMGMSYGAGISLLTAAHDPRVKAVVALSTWADLAQVYDQDRTPNKYGLGVLIGGTHPKAPFDDTVRRLRETLLDSPARVGPLLRSISPERSPDNFVRQLNANKPAIMIANAFEDSLFNPRQVIPFFDALHTAKRLELAAGDHGGPELSALSGQPNQTVDDAEAWLDHYMRGTPNGINTEDPIIFREVRTGQLYTYKRWPTATKKDEVTLAAPGTALRPGDAANPTWTATIRHAGTDSGASSGNMQFGSSDTYTPPPIVVPAIKPDDAFVWNGPALSSPVVLGGTPTVHLGLSSTSRTATIYLHLYDVDDTGHGSLVSFQPYTATGLSASKPRELTIDMQPISWSVPSGDHLTLVIDTYDQRYQSLTPAGNSVTVSSTSGEPAWFSAPFTT